jgi:hypothetical protein
MSDEARLEYYRHRAESARALAAKLRDQTARQKWVEIAERYDSLANMTERTQSRQSF